MKNGAIKQSTLTVKQGDALEEKTKLPQYQGYRIQEIDLGWNEVRFDNGVVLETGEAHVVPTRQAIFEAQIRYTIEEHFRRQARLKERKIKVLSLFFIDKVDNYVNKNGIIRQLFDKWFNTLKQQERYSEWREKESRRCPSSLFRTKPEANRGNRL